jgi:hypothetical protein
MAEGGMSGTPHKHRDVIIAWANGEAIEYLDSAKQWYPFTAKYPPYDDTMTYRIKPKRVKKEGWVAVYGGNFTSERIHQTRAECMAKCPNAIVYIRIEWEGEL